MHAEPQASRPYMPGYGILPSSEGRGLLEWSWALERLARSHDYWLATVWPDGRPHLMPVWGVWLRESLWFSSSASSRKAKNLARDARCVVSTDDPLEPVVMEGVAGLVVDREEIAAFVHAVNVKYATDYAVDFFEPPANACYRVRPTWVFALSEEDFTGSPTRWRFPG